MEYILFIEGRYLLWSTSTDAPIIHRGLSYSELVQWIADEYGRRGIQELPARIARAIVNGTSSDAGETINQIIAGNHAGEDGSCLTLEEITEYYIRQGGNGPVPRGSFPTDD